MENPDWYGKNGHMLPHDVTSMIYFEGDFTKSLSAAQQIYSDYVKDKNTAMKYNLLFNNCMQLSADLLLKGTFTNYDSDYRTALSRTKDKIIPNDAYKAMNQFNKYIDSYNKKSAWDKFWIKPSQDPWRYLPGPQLYM